MFVKCVFSIPSSLAFWFISSTKASVLPEHTYCAKTSHASFADATSTAYKSCSTVNSSPGRMPIWLAPVPITESTISLATTVLPSSSPHFSKTSVAVMIFVVLAGYIFSSIFFPKSILPVSISIKIAALPYTSGSFPSAKTAPETDESIIVITAKNKTNIFFIIKCSTP